MDNKHTDECCEHDKQGQINGRQPARPGPARPGSKLKSRLFVGLLVAAAVFAFFVFFRYGSGSTALLWDLSNGGKWLFPLVTVSAVLDSINPCAFSILLLTIAFLFSVGRLRSSILKIGGAYIFGIFLIYLLIGLGILQTLHLFNTPHFMAKVGAGLLIALGLINLINEFFPRFPIKLKIPEAAHHKMAELMDKASIPTAFLLGTLVGICEFPCTGGPYLMILGLLHDNATFLSGFWYLIFYNVIFVLPLAIILFMASDKVLLETMEKWKAQNNKQMRFWSGIVMLALGVLIFYL